MVHWQDILRDSVRDNTVKLSHLRKIPHLKTCDNWKAATFLGRVRHTLPYCTYDGGLIRLGDAIYYINAAQIDAVRKFARFRNLANVIAVIEE